MGIEDLKRWHWIVIGIIVGAILAGARLMAEPDETNSADTRISAETFVYGFGHDTGDADHPLFRNVVVYPPVNDLDYVTAEELMPITGKSTFQYKPVSFHGTRPFRVSGHETLPSVRDFLERRRQETPSATFRYAWWNDSRFVWEIWIIGGAIVIGGIWPTLLNLMIGAGFGRPKKEKETFDLSRFKGEAAKSEEKKVVTKDDVDQLRALEAQLEANLKPSGAGHSADAAATSEAPVRALTGGPVELQSATEPQDDVDYKGEFYPVARTQGKKED